jgi:hypothetical protein
MRLVVSGGHRLSAAPCTHASVPFVPKSRGRSICRTVRPTPSPHRGAQRVSYLIKSSCTFSGFFISSRRSPRIAHCDSIFRIPALGAAGRVRDMDEGYLRVPHAIHLHSLPAVQGHVHLLNEGCLLSFIVRERVTAVSASRPLPVSHISL